MEVPGKADDGARAKVAGGAAIGLAAALAICLLLPGLREPVTFDGVHVYLPMARRLAEEGLRYLQDPDCVRVAPFAYVYPALLGGHEDWVRWANVASFAAAVVLLGATAWKAHSMRAGIAAAFLAAASPLLRRWVPDVLTEAPFIFLAASWLFALGRLAAGGGRAWIALAGAALGLASLTRPAASLFAPLACAGFAVRAWKGQGDGRRIDARIAMAHFAATLAWAAWLVHNTVSFGFPAIAGGAGNATWLGINPLTDGWDPVYLGLDYDDGALTGGLNPLSIPGDRMLAAAARLEIGDTPFLQLAALMARKAVAFVFVPPVEVFAYRGWRIAFVVLAAVGAWRNRRSREVQVAAAFTLYMVAVHVPVLFTVRYSVTALDVSLALLAGIGLAECANARVAQAVVPALGAAYAIGWLTFGPRLPPAPRLEHAFVEPRWSADGSAARIVAHAQPVGPQVSRLSPGAVLELEVRDAPGLHPADVTLAAFDMALEPAARGTCSAMRLRFRARTDAAYASERKISLPLEADGRMHRYVVGTTVPLHLGEEGMLRLEFDCAGETRLTFRRVQVFTQVRGQVYRARLAR